MVKDSSQRAAIRSDCHENAMIAIRFYTLGVKARNLNPWMHFISATCCC
jgi:hypothetical protein